MTEENKLLALYTDAGRNIDNFKQDIRTYLVYYSAIAAAIIAAYEQPSHYTPPHILFWLSIGAWICRILVWDIYNKCIYSRRWTLRRVFKKFTEKSEIFMLCINPTDPDFEKITNKGLVDRSVYHIQLIYPFVVLALIWAWLYPFEVSWIPVLGLPIAVILCLVCDTIFLNLMMTKIQKITEITEKDKKKDKYLEITNIFFGFCGAALPIFGLAYYIVS